MEIDPIACSLEQNDLDSRRSRWHALAARAPVEITPTERGLTLRFSGGGAEARDELRALAELERECCAFAEWSVRAEGTAAFLEVTGKYDDAVPAVQAMFRTLKS